jgi:hypothetical protein
MPKTGQPRLVDFQIPKGAVVFGHKILVLELAAMVR